MCFALASPCEGGTKKPEVTDGETEAQQGEPLPKFHSLSVRVNHQCQSQIAWGQDEVSLHVPELCWDRACVPRPPRPSLPHSPRVRASKIQIR